MGDTTCQDTKGFNVPGFHELSLHHNLFGNIPKGHYCSGSSKLLTDGGNTVFNEFSRSIAVYKKGVLCAFKCGMKLQRPLYR